MIKNKKKPLIIILVIVLFTSVACTNTQTSENDIYTLKMYSWVQWQYYSLGESFNRLEGRINLHQEAAMNPEIIGEENMKIILDGKEKNQEELLTSIDYAIALEDALINETKFYVDVSDVNQLMTDYVRISKFLDEFTEALNKYNDDEISFSEISPLLYEGLTYSKIAKDNYSKCVGRQNEMFFLIQNYKIEN